ncbi:MAG: hypothetical protein AB7O24_25040 [Kofleriaceae bacterium]
MIALAGPGGFRHADVTQEDRMKKLAIAFAAVSLLATSALACPDDGHDKSAKTAQKDKDKDKDKAKETDQAKAKEQPKQKEKPADKTAKPDKAKEAKPADKVSAR